MATTEKWGALGTETTVFSNSDLSAMANNALVLSSAINNVQGGGGGDGARFARITVTTKMAVAATANTGFSFWFLKSQDGGTTYERGGTGYTPLRTPDLVVPAPTDTTQTVQMFDVEVPPGFLKFLKKNDGTGQALATDTTSTGSKVTIAFYTRQSV